MCPEGTYLIPAGNFSYERCISLTDGRAVPTLEQGGTSALPCCEQKTKTIDCQNQIKFGEIVCPPANAEPANNTGIWILIAIVIGLIIYFKKRK